VEKVLGGRRKEGNKKRKGGLKKGRKEGRQKE
jgi:hypothetical protein